MDDVGSLFLGAALVAGGILLTPVSAPIGLGVMRVGLGFVRSSIRGFISGRPTPQGIQANVGSPDATVPVLYGEARIGGKVYDVRTIPDPDTGIQELCFRGLAFCVASENGQGIEGYQSIRLDDVVPVRDGRVARV